MARGHLREVAPGVLVGTSRFMVTNTVVVVHEGRALVIDPGVHDDELTTIAGELAAGGLEVTGGFATHAHWDHVLWHRGLGEVPRWASPRTAADAELGRADLLTEASRTTAVDRDRFARLVPIGDGVPWEGADIEAVVHDAHCAGHTALHLPDRGVLIAGDMVSDVEVPLLDPEVAGPAALAAHHEGLDRLAALPDVELVVPGHGHPGDRAAWHRRVDADRRYLDDLAAGRTGDDRRLAEPWLAEADAAMRARLTKAAWRRWAGTLPPPLDRAGAVRDAVSGFLGASPGVVAGYVALADEVDLGPLLTQFDEVVLPRLDDGRVTWHRAGGQLEQHPFGLSQPAADAERVDPSTFDVVLVPGRLFDRHGARLGRGGGHYDRLVPRLGRDVPVVGVAVEERIVPRLPTEGHDARMTHLATESGVRVAP